MREANIAVALALVLNIGIAMWRIARGPTAADRMQAGLLFGTVGVAVLLVLAQALARPALRDVALALALLAGVVTVAFVRRDGAGPR